MFHKGFIKQLSGILDVGVSVQGRLTKRMEKAPTRVFVYAAIRFNKRSLQIVESEGFFSLWSFSDFHTFGLQNPINPKYRAVEFISLRSFAWYLFDCHQPLVYKNNC